MTAKKYVLFFCYISKAFDRVWHKGPLFKLHSVSISGSLLCGLQIIWLIEYKE